MKLISRIYMFVVACAAVTAIQCLPADAGELLSFSGTTNITASGGGVEITAGTFDCPLTIAPSGHTTVFFLRSNHADIHLDKTTVSLSNNDILRLPAYGCRITSADNDSVEAFIIRFTDGADLTPSLKDAVPQPLDRLQFFRPQDGIDARMVQTAGGHVAFLRLNRDMNIPVEHHESAAWYIITRGTSDAVIDGERENLETGDVFFVGHGGTAAFSTGPRGMDVLAVYPGGREDYARKLDRRMAAIHGIVEPGSIPKLIVDGETESPGLTFTEGPSWMNGRLYFSNYYKFWKPFGSSEEGGIQVVDENGVHRVLNMNVQTCGTTPLPNGMLAVCDLFGRSVVEMDPETGAVGRTIAASYDGIPFAVANDVITDRKGGLYITDSSVAKTGPKQPGTALYYVRPSGEIIRVTEPGAVDYINGVVLTPDDKTLYLNGSGEEYILAFDVADDGSLRNRRPFARLYSLEKELDKERPRSVPDGMTIDSTGRLYVATPFGIQVFDSNGDHVGIIHIPRQPSHCVFGGDDYSTLFVTARKHVYAIKTLATGIQYPIR